MKKTFVLLAAIALVACTAPRGVIENPVYVDRVVMVPCLDSVPDKPFLVVPTITDRDGIELIADAYMIDRRLLLGYTAVLESALIACVARPSEGLGSVPGKAINNPGSGER